MDADKLPSEHDVIVLGTGMTESIIAAALSRIGLRVLHLDRNDNYGGDWGSFNFSALQDWISAFKGQANKEAADKEVPSSAVDSNEKLVLLPLESSTVTNVQEFIFIPGEVDQGGCDGGAAGGADSRVGSTTSTGADQEGTRPEIEGGAVAESATGSSGEVVTVDGTGEKQDVAEKRKLPYENIQSLCLDFATIKRQWRKFSLDLMPKILYSRGALVELLISSDVAKYCEFRTITRVLTLLKGKLELVPCSRADVFASHDVSVFEKRLLMKFLTFAIEFEKHAAEYTGFEERPFIEFLKSKRLTETIQHYIQHAIAMATDTTTTMEGLMATQKFLLSLGRYGNTAFLWPLYGSGELLQCFCRMCAVFGGIYCLRRTAKAVVLNSDEKVVAVVDTEGQRLETKWLVMNASYASSQFLPQIQNSSRLSRAILVTDRSVKANKEQQITLMSLPIPGRSDSRVTVYELSSLSMACPEGFHVVHLTCRSLAEDAKTDLQSAIDVLFQATDQENVDDSRPRIIWSLFFNLNDSSRVNEASSSNVGNLIIVGGPNADLDCDHSITVAKSVFEKICPGEEFLPKAPNPEDIVFDDGDSTPARESGFEPIPEASTESEGLESVHVEITTQSEVDVSVASGDRNDASEEALVDVEKPVIPNVESISSDSS